MFARVVLLCLSALACGSQPSRATDAGAPAEVDAGPRETDAGPGDAGAPDAGLLSDAGHDGGAADAGPPASVCARYPGTQIVTNLRNTPVVVGPAADGKGRLVGLFVAKPTAGRVASSSPSVVNFGEGRVVLSPTACDFEGRWALRSSPTNAIATFQYAPDATRQVVLVPGNTYAINVEFDSIPSTVVCNVSECNWFLEHQ